MAANGRKVTTCMSPSKSGQLGTDTDLSLRCEDLIPFPRLSPFHGSSANLDRIQAIRGAVRHFQNGQSYHVWSSVNQTERRLVK